MAETESLCGVAKSRHDSCGLATGCFSSGRSESLWGGISGGRRVLVVVCVCVELRCETNAEPTEKVRQAASCAPPHLTCHRPVRLHLHRITMTRFQSIKQAARTRLLRCRSVELVKWLVAMTLRTRNRSSRPSSTDPNSRLGSLEDARTHCQRRRRRGLARAARPDPLARPRGPAPALQGSHAATVGPGTAR